MKFETSNAELLKQFNERVYGHETAKKALLTLVSRSRMRIHQKFELGVPDDELLEPCKLLLIGDSGTGKTMLVEQLAYMLDFPLLMLDATQLSPGSGKDGTGADKISQLCNDTVKIWLELQRKLGYTYSLEGARDRLVVYIDEIDKLACSFESSGNWNKHIQNSFLTMFDNHGDGAGVSFIFSGAFSGMKKEETSNGIGFNAVKTEKKRILDEDIVKHGLVPELVGRLTAIVELDTFDKADYEHILHNVLLPRTRAHLSFFNGATLELTGESAERMIALAITSKQGVRHLKRQLNALSLEAEFNYEDNDIQPTAQY